MSARLAYLKTFLIASVAISPDSEHWDGDALISQSG